VTGEDARGSETEVDDPSSGQSAWIATSDPAIPDVSNSTTRRQNSFRWLGREACLLIKCVPKNNVIRTKLSILKLDLKTLCARVDCSTHTVLFGHLAILLRSPCGVIRLLKNICNSYLEVSVCCKDACTVYHMDWNKGLKPMLDSPSPQFSHYFVIVSGLLLIICAWSGFFFVINV
jgi:hypothetical protein